MSRNLIALQNKFLGEGRTVYDELARIHERQGAVGDDDILRLARDHNLPPSHVRATAKFYDELGQDRAAEHTLKICIGEACRAAGCDAVLSRCEDALAIEAGEVSREGARLEHVACLGYCGLGPNAMVDGQPLSLADNDALDDALDHVRGTGVHSLPEPVNAVYPPVEGEPCVLLRHAGHEIVGLERARSRGIYSALEKARSSMTPQQVIDEVKASQLRGRGGAGFPAGVKLQTVADSEAPDGSGRRFVVVNFDEGDAGAYIDKELIERDPHTQIEGVLLAAHATGASTPTSMPASSTPGPGGSSSRPLTRHGLPVSSRVARSPSSGDRGPTSAARRRASCARWRACRRWSAHARPFRPRRDCGAARRRSTTSRRSTTFPGSSSTAARPTRLSAQRGPAAPSS